MKWTRFLLLLFLIPSLSYAYFDTKDCTKILNKLTAEWNRHNELVEQFSKLGAGDKERGVVLLQEAIACCLRGVGYCDTILNKIADKHKKERYLTPWPEIKEERQRDKNNLSHEMGELQKVLNTLLSNIAVEKAQSLYLQSQNKALSAGTKYEESRACSASDIDAAIARLGEAALLYEEAALHAREALSTLSAAPTSNENDKAALQQNANIYREVAERCRQEALYKKEVASTLTAKPRYRPQEESFSLSREAFKAREQKRRELFFNNDLGFIPDLCLDGRANVVSLDGQVRQKGKNYTLYTEQFYRFLVQSDTASQLLIKVYDNAEIVHEEVINLPFKNVQQWDRYVRDGLLFLPDTPLTTRFGLDLRLELICDPNHPFSMIVAQKGGNSQYVYSIALNDESPLYAFHCVEPPPWQLGVLRKPTLPQASQPLSKTSFSAIDALVEGGEPLEDLHFPVLDELVNELQRDPITLAAYVQNEIALVDPYLHRGEGIFYAPRICRSVYRTYLDKQGTPWEQCQLLIYLLRKAGCKALYAIGDYCTLPKPFVEKMLFTKIPEEQEEVRLCYPWVLVQSKGEWISLFPWMKEVGVDEGYDLYSLMPEEYASSSKWIFSYLKGDENLFKYMDEDDSLGVLFERHVSEEVAKQGLSLSDVGLHRTELKKHFSSWSDFPSPLMHNTPYTFVSLEEKKGLFATAAIEIYSHENPQKKISVVIPLTHLSCDVISFSFPPGADQLRVQIPELGDFSLLDLDEKDHLIDVKVTFAETTQIFSMVKGTSAAFCAHYGGIPSQVTAHFHQKFISEKEEEKRLHALLALVGTAYFEKCGRAEKMLSCLHKLSPATLFAFGLTKLVPDPSKGSLEPTLPQVDMFWLRMPPPDLPDPSYTARMHLDTLMTVDSSSNEHQILREVFKDPAAISAVKLLQLAHLEHKRKSLSGEGFLVLTPAVVKVAKEAPATLQNLYFSHLPDFNLGVVKTASSGQWAVIEEMLHPENPENCFSYAYVTPGLTSSPNASYKEMGALIFCPHTQYALISNHNLWFHGGLGTPLPSHLLTPQAIREWQLIPHYQSYLFQPSPLSTPPILSEVKKGGQEVRPEYKSYLSSVADPVDVMTGAFYIDEVDLALMGPFPLEIRRNYSSQSCLPGSLGCGWKLSLNPFLIEQEGKLYAAEADGTVIAYRFNEKTSRFEVFPEDNPDLYNMNQKGIGSTASPFHAYIENDVLYGSDGSKRYFENGLLGNWVDARGNALTFLYVERQLSRIKSSNGHFCGFHYNCEGMISEIYAQDGRRISYTYSPEGDLTTVTLPSGACISYEYDSSHQITCETKPHGKRLENIYKEGRVEKQLSPMGINQAMTVTATFDYQEGLTTVTDSAGGKTTYKIFNHQIYKIVDPLGHQTLQSWFIDETSWFDPEKEQVVEYSGLGGAARSLKASTDKRGLTTYYLYDRRGNPVEIGLQGADLTGSGGSQAVKTLIYNAQNLCIQEDVADHKTVTTYDPTFAYLPRKIEKYFGNTLLSSIEWVYNSLGQIEKEDHLGAVNLWQYDSRGFPTKKIQLTGSEDPDVVTEYSYNNQGQCTRVATADSVQENAHDLMGNVIQSKNFSYSGRLLSATYFGYNLNNALAWKQGANPQNTLYLDYNTSGLLKASRQYLDSSGAASYTLYEYDSCGYLIEEVDPLGYCTYRDYDALGRVICETKEGHATHFTYEAGGLVKTVVSPAGGTTTRHYTTNGLLTEETYPDGTSSSMIYDLLGRPVQETRHGITWEIHYDDAHHRVVRTHPESHISEIQEWDPRGNLIKFTDSTGNTFEKIYDGLNRLKTQTTPSGEKTVWNYQGDTILCTLPNAERIATRYAGGQVIESEVRDLEGTLIAHTIFYRNPQTGVEEIIQGEEITTTWLNAFGLPIQIQQGDVTTFYEYNPRGDCIAITDGEGRVTRQRFDGLRRMILKELPDGSAIHYSYDLDSHLAAVSHPNGVVWVATHDLMGRKCSEELQAAGLTSAHWEYRYENGYLKEAKDPMERVHIYSYDSLGSLSQENVGEWQRTYTYDPRGALLSAEQDSDSTHSQVKRSYDLDGRLTGETITLGSQLIQQTHQSWQGSNRALQVNDHERHMTYQNGRLVEVATSSVVLSYSYSLSGSLTRKTTPLSHTTIENNFSGLPEQIFTYLPHGSSQESLQWSASGKLLAYTSPGQQKQFKYTDRGHLLSAGSENYTFDFGAAGTGIRTAAPQCSVPQEGLDTFGKIIDEISDQIPLESIYDPMGQVITQGQKQFEWDPWGRLIKVIHPTFTWEASYDALGRRLQTHYTLAQGTTLTTTSFYDPEKEFQEIGTHCAGKTFWKIYGPQSCDAIIDATSSAILVHNALGELAAVLSKEGVFYTEQFPSSYGPQSDLSSIFSDLLSYAQSLTWHSLAQDPTGLIWMGARYYDPKGGRFLSPDPIGYPHCLDLYAYAGGDPVNYFDPNGRFFSPVYQKVSPLAIPIMTAVSSWCEKLGLTRSHAFQVGSFDLPNGAINVINGINNKPSDAIESATRLSQYAHGAKIYGIYNATNSIPVDIVECVAGHMGALFPPAHLLKKQWNRWFDTHGPNAKVFQACHSHGADQVYNALETSPEAVRQRIIVLAIAPSVIIPRKLCYRSYNYISRRDIVTHLDIIGKLRYGNELHVLEPHPDANFWDHEFLSPTFAKPINDHIEDYIKNYAGAQ